MTEPQLPPPPAPQGPVDGPGSPLVRVLMSLRHSRKAMLLASVGVVLTLVAGMVTWLAWPEPAARDRTAFEEAVAGLAGARGVRYTDTSIIGEEREITTTEFGEQFGVTGHPGLERNDQGVLRVGGKLYTKFQRETGRLGKWKAGDPNDEYHYGDLLEEFPTPGSLSATLAAALADVPELPAPTDPGLPAHTVGGVPALAAETPAGTLYVARERPYRVLRLEPQGPLSPSRLRDLSELSSLPALPPGLGSGSLGNESQGMDLAPIDDASVDQMYDTLVELTRQLTDAVDAGINFSLTSAARLKCSAAGCTVSASFKGTVLSKARERITSSGHVTARLTVTNVTIDGRPAGGCVSPPTKVRITGNTASGRLSCVDKAAGPVFAAVDREYAARAQQQANACGCKVTLRFSSQGESEIDALAVARAEVDELLAQQKRGRELGTCKTPNSFVPGTPVLLADGTTRPIERVTLGTRVRATDPTTGRTAAEPVLAQITGSGTKQLHQITVTDDRHTGTVTATADHPFWAPTRRDWIDADELRTGESLAGLPGQNPVRVTAKCDQVGHLAEGLVSCEDEASGEIWCYYVALHLEGSVKDSKTKFELLDVAWADMGYPDELHPVLFPHELHPAHVLYTQTLVNRR